MILLTWLKRKKASTYLKVSKTSHSDQTWQRRAQRRLLPRLLPQRRRWRPHRSPLRLIGSLYLASMILCSFDHRYYSDSQSMIGIWLSLHIKMALMTALCFLFMHH